METRSGLCQSTATFTSRLCSSNAARNAPHSNQLVRVLTAPNNLQIPLKSSIDMEQAVHPIQASAAGSWHHIGRRSVRTSPLAPPCRCPSPLLTHLARASRCSRASARFRTAPAESPFRSSCTVRSLPLCRGEGHKSVCVIVDSA